MLKVQRLEDILLDSMVDQMLESQIACFRRILAVDSSLHVTVRFPCVRSTSKLSVHGMRSTFKLSM